LGTSDFARDVFETVLSKYEAYGERIPGLLAHRHSYNAFRIQQHFNRRFGYFARMAPRDLGWGEGYVYTVVTFLERADIPLLTWRLRFWAFLQLAYLSRISRSEMSLPIRFGNMRNLVGLLRLGCLGGCGPRRSGRFGSGLGDPFPYNVRRSRARAHLRRCSNGADHGRTASDCDDYSGVPPA
jgi:hypothetical protein